MRGKGNLEDSISELLADPQYEGHPLKEALEALVQQQQDQLAQLERLTSIADGYQTVMREKNQSLTERYYKQIRHLEKIVKISDRYQKMLTETNRALQIASTHDPLTGLPNRRMILDRLSAETVGTDRRKQPFSLVMMDIDHFKTINDRFGHASGDQALVSIARAMLETLRPYDVCARWGGEEFLGLLPGATGLDAQQVAERLCEKVASLRLTGLPEEASLTLSVGVAEFNSGSTLDETIRRADQALYAAKRKGRNQVVLL